MKDNIARDAFFWIEALPVKQEPVSDQSTVSGLWGILTVQLTPLSPLFIGSGEVDLHGTGMYFRFARRGDRYVIPGTSLKGAVRTVAEALSPSCLRVTKPASSESCRLEEDAFKLCPACGLFGAPGYRGRVSFDDAMVEGLPQLPPQQPVTTIHQRTGPRWCGPTQDPCEATFDYRKFYARAFDATTCRVWKGKWEKLEVIQQATFATKISFQNLKEWELGLLILALGAAPGQEFNFKLGGAKNRGMGLVRAGLMEGQYAEGKSWFLGERKDLTGSLTTLIQAYEQQLTRWERREAVQEVIRCLREEYGHGA